MKIKIDHSLLIKRSIQVLTCCCYAISYAQFLHLYILLSSLVCCWVSRPPYILNVFFTCENRTHDFFYKSFWSKILCNPCSETVSGYIKNINFKRLSMLNYNFLLLTLSIACNHVSLYSWNTHARLLGRASWETYCR